MQRRFAFLIIFLIIFVAACNQKEESPANEPETQTIAILKLAPNLDPMITNFKAHLLANGYDQINYIEAPTVEALQAAIDPADVDLYLVSPARFGTINYTLQIKAFAPTTPILFAPSITDPVADGLVESLEKPGGNITGILVNETGDERRFDLLLQMMPTADHIFVAYDPANETAVVQLPLIEETAATRNVELTLVPTANSSATSFEEILATFDEEADGIFLLKVWSSGPHWTELSRRYQIPLIQDSTTGAGLFPVMAYGPTMESIGEQAARYAGQILQGTPPGELPIENAELYLVIDLGMADTIGFEVPPSIIDQADKILHSTVLLPTPTTPPTSTACNAMQTSPLGSLRTCLSMACDELPTDGPATFTERVDVASCATENLVGICVRSNVRVHFYEGDPATLEMGCGLAGGTWEN